MPPRSEPRAPGLPGVELLRRTWARRSWYALAAILAIWLATPFLSTGYIVLFLKPKMIETMPAQMLGDFVNATLLVLALCVADTAVVGGARPWRTYVLGLLVGALLASVLQWHLLEALGMPTFSRRMSAPVEHRRLQMAFMAASDLMVGGLFLWVHVQWRASRLAAQAAHRAEHARHAIAQQAEMARLLALQSRVEPQWLFDVMAHVRALWRRDAQAGATLLDDTIATLRHAMPPKAMQSTLARERELLDGQLRIRAALHRGTVPSLHVDIPSQLAPARFAPLVLWPLMMWLADAQAGPSEWHLSAEGRVAPTGKARLVLALRSSDGRWPDDEAVLALLRTRLVAVHGGSARLAARRDAPGVDLELDVALHKVMEHDAESIDR
jgi:hypothetical protein